MKDIRGKKIFIKKIAEDAIVILLDRAEKNYVSHPNRTTRYLEMIWALVKKYKTMLSKNQKIKFCRKCRNFLIPSMTLRLTFDANNKEFYAQCLKCGYKRAV